jgi:malate dehydrogenase (oxaloacetate-decarboxylating)
MHRDRWTNQTGYKTRARGMAVLASPQLNKGSAFTLTERADLGLVGLLPPAISTLDDQQRRAYISYQRLPDALSRNVYLTALHDRNEVLFYRLFSLHLHEMIPIVNDLTVGLAMEHYRHECRRHRGVYLSIDHPESIEQSFTNFGVGPDDIDLILATDAEQIPGLGDWGVGGIEVAIGKLAIYTAAGGIDPARVIPVMLDVGTDRSSLLTDPMYIGNRHPRTRGPAYDEFIDAYVKVVTRLFPHAVLQWEDFAPANGRTILSKYRRLVPTFNDDMQGTGAIVLAAAISAVRICGTPLRKQRVVIFGAGTAGIGVADQLRDAMVRDGLSINEANRRFWCVDRDGLVTQPDTPTAYPGNSTHLPYARPAADSKDWDRDPHTALLGLAETVHRVQPTMLIGASAVSGAFTEAIVREMAAHVDRPIVFPLSTPAAHAEATPADLIEWTDGRALIAAGSEFMPVTWRGVTHVIGKTSNTKLYPGLCLGAIVSRARLISDGMLAAAAFAVSSLVTVRQPGASLIPHTDDLRSVSLTVAIAVAECAIEEGLSSSPPGAIAQQIRDAMWQPEYRILEAV